MHQRIPSELEAVQYCTNMLAQPFEIPLRTLSVVHKMTDKRIAESILAFRPQIATTIHHQCNRGLISKLRNGRCLNKHVRTTMLKCIQDIIKSHEKKRIHKQKLTQPINASKTKRHQKNRKHKTKSIENSHEIKPKRHRKNKKKKSKKKKRKRKRELIIQDNPGYKSDEINSNPNKRRKK
eukprot:296745_1